MRGAHPEPKAKYDAIIIGAGGHGLATAYYLGKNFGITNVAILEKGWLGGGNTGRNTTIIRSNYLQDPSAALYEKARSLYETMSQDLNYNVMFSPAGVIMLAQTAARVRGYQRTAHANALQGLTHELIGPAEGQRTVPDHNLRWAALSCAWVALWQAARRHRAPRCCGLGLCAGLLGYGDGYHPAMRSDRMCVNLAAKSGVDTTKGAIDCDKLGHCCCGTLRSLWRYGGFRLPLESVALQALGVRADQTMHGCGGDGQHGARLYEPV